MFCIAVVASYTLRTASNIPTLNITTRTWKLPILNITSVAFFSSTTKWVWLILANRFVDSYSHFKLRKTYRYIKYAATDMLLAQIRGIHSSIYFTMCMCSINRCINTKTYSVVSKVLSQLVHWEEGKNMKVQHNIMQSKIIPKLKSLMYFFKLMYGWFAAYSKKKLSLYFEEEMVRNLELSRMKPCGRECVKLWACINVFVFQSVHIWLCMVRSCCVLLVNSTMTPN